MSLNRQTIFSVILLALLVAVPFAAPYIGGNYVISQATRVIILAIAALSLDLLIGRGNLVSFGHAAYFGLGGYVVAIASFHLANDVPLFGWAGSNEALIVWPLAMLVSGLAALIIGALSLRTSGVYFIMITLAFAQMLYFVFVALKYYGGDDGLSMRSRNLFAGERITNATSFYWVCLGALALCLLVQWRLIVSRDGQTGSG